jgi:predicted transcriptional regulator
MLTEIGSAAGSVYCYLAKNGEVTLANLKKNLDLKPDMITYSLGWLAREGKISITKKGNSTKILLTEKT